jgi:hypothetical protein
MPARAADCYVFCLHSERDREQALLRILDVSSWEFYVVATPELERLYSNQKTLRLSVLLKHCAPVSYDRLRATVDAALDPPS